MKGDRGDAFFADLVEREVIAKGRRAVLISGADHLRRGIHANTAPDDPNLATLLEREHPRELFIVYPLPYESDAELGHQIEDALASWPSPSLALLHDTWLGAQGLSHRSLAPRPGRADMRISA